MDDMVHVLWEYASRYRLDGFYDRDAQRGRDGCACAAEKNRIALEAACPPDLLRRVSALCDSLEEIRSYDMEAAFACGFHLGTSLR